MTRDEQIEAAKVEAVIEFVKKLKEKLDYYYAYVLEEDIDKTAKEVLGKHYEN